MKERLGCCGCEGLQFSCKGDPSQITICHCLECQRQSGSAFSLTAFFERSALSISRGATKTFARGSILGTNVTSHFCPNCGSTVFTELERMPQHIGVAVGALGDPSFPAPKLSIFADSMHPWLRLPDEIRAFAALPPARAGHSDRK